MALSLKRGRGGATAGAASLDGSMTLIEHLRELRKRLVKAVLAILVATIVAWFFFDPIFVFLKRPLDDVVAQLAVSQGLDARLTLTGVADPLTLQLKTSLVTGIVAASPVWLYQIWAFIVPGLHAKERRWSLLFAGVAGPLFIAGVAIGYYVLPKGLGILLSFTPGGVSNLLEVSRYLSFILRMLLVFGVAFEIPLFVVMLNLAGVVKGRQLAGARSWIIVGTFVFAAVATPSTDPVSMLFLALPMTALFLISEVIARVLDNRRGVGAEGAYDEWDDEATSPLQVSDDPHDALPSDLDDPGA
ncbi:MAG: twin-arginine translocase subunit TatC [Nocardioidaceae bacterium]